MTSPSIVTVNRMNHQRGLNGDLSPLVVPPSEVAGSLIPAEVLDLTSTPVQVLFPDGLVSLLITYLDLGSAVGARAFYVFDPFSATDAATKLATAGSRIFHMIGKDDSLEILFDDDSPVYSVYMNSDVASETGSSVVRLFGRTPQP